MICPRYIFWFFRFQPYSIYCNLKFIIAQKTKVQRSWTFYSINRISLSFFIIAFPNFFDELLIFNAVVLKRTSTLISLFFICFLIVRTLSQNFFSDHLGISGLEEPCCQRLIPFLTETSIARDEITVVLRDQPIARDEQNSPRSPIARDEFFFRDPRPR